MLHTIATCEHEHINMIVRRKNTSMQDSNPWSFSLRIVCTNGSAVVGVVLRGMYIGRLRS